MRRSQVIEKEGLISLDEFVTGASVGALPIGS